ncbi:predicted protein [Pyrenophora tritici-repentis Pt-1C-BFP]|uniref:Uncharacterized protein n=1 Tax=Pyrenophora tritici-repentis (strain Pt-1C-BFP) TaxID=426418 RepID=B2W0E6_PYRTR|nr:uncharacterized protein PTRG_03931 [Pyrenophora tritici-repentis Pt-1C-BFP]EDU46769.1 predicted protein [Pyrenophora tritici-repentis Pt-1C-BFP]
MFVSTANVHSTSKSGQKSTVQLSHLRDVMVHYQCPSRTPFQNQSCNMKSYPMEVGSEG